MLRKEGAVAEAAQRPLAVLVCSIAANRWALASALFCGFPKLVAMLDSDKPLRLKPVPTSKMERRSVHEASLQRHLAVLRNADLAALAKAFDKTEQD